MKKCDTLKDRGGRCFASVQSVSSKGEEVRNRAQGFQWLLEGNPDALEEARVSSQQRPVAMSYNYSGKETQNREH